MKTFEDLSRENCHVKGLHSLVLRPGAPDGTTRMLRMYIAEPGIILGHRLLEPTIAYHCHQYDIQIQCLSGVLVNHVLKFCEGEDWGVTIRGWTFSSQLHGANGPMFVESAELRRIKSCMSTRMEQGDVYTGLSSEYHTVSIPRENDFTSWLVEETPATGGYDPTAYSNADLSGLNADGLYGSMTQSRYLELLSYAMHSMNPKAISLLMSYT